MALNVRKARPRAHGLRPAARGGEAASRGGRGVGRRTARGRGSLGRRLHVAARAEGSRSGRRRAARIDAARRRMVRSLDQLADGRAPHPRALRGERHRDARRAGERRPGRRQVGQARAPHRRRPRGVRQVQARARRDRRPGDLHRRRSARARSRSSCTTARAT